MSHNNQHEPMEPWVFWAGMGIIMLCDKFNNLKKLGHMPLFYLLKNKL